MNYEHVLNWELNELFPRDEDGEDLENETF